MQNYKITLLIVRFATENPYLYGKKSNVMDRTFQSRITVGQYLALLIYTIMTIYGLWHKEWLAILVFMLLLVLLIEQLIHSACTVRAEGELVIFRGRFRRVRHIALQDISLAERVKAPLFGALFVSHYVLVHYKDGKTLALLPANEEEFLKTLAKQGCKVVFHKHSRKPSVND